MKWFANVSFRTKLLLLLMSVSTISLLLASGGFVWQQHQGGLEDQARETQILARATAYNLSAALAFDDESAAVELLQALRADSHIEFALLKDGQSDPFASFGTRPTMNEDLLVVFEPVMLDGNRLGELEIISRHDSWFDRWQEQVKVVGSIALLALLVAFLLAVWLQAGLTRTVRHMAAAMQRVSQKRDYTVRVKKSSEDELGQLVDGFNAMLGQIQSHESELDEKVRLRTLALVRELDERKRAEQSRDKVLHALNQAGEGVMLADDAGHVAYVNPAFTTITGFRLDDFTADSAPLLQAGVLSPDDLFEMELQVNTTAAWQKELRCRRKDGIDYPALLHAVYVDAEQKGEAHQVFILRDLSERQELENELRQAQKMEAIGVLVGGIAHDFNNMLASILGSVELARMDRHDADKLDAWLQNIESGGFRAAEMIRKMLAFARKDRVEFNVTYLHDFFKDSQSLAALAVPESVHLEFIEPSEPLWGNIDSNQMEQVLLNLVNNAVDAVQDSSRPTVTVAMHHYVSDAQFLARYPDAKGGEYARLSVSDNGHGMDASVRDKIFEPFFTTKEVGKGTGLGLAMVYGTAQRHGCLVDVESVVGEGTTFHVYIPLAAPPKEQSATAPRPDAPVDGVSWMVLLADDDAEVRQSLQLLLERMGCRTLVARDGHEAVVHVQEHQREIHAVVMDLVMPRLDGVKAASQIRQIRPDMPIVFATGCDLNDVLDEAKSMDGTHLLFKPYHSQELSEAIQKLITRSYRFDI